MGRVRIRIGARILAFTPAAPTCPSAVSGGSAGLISGVRSFESSETTKLKITRIHNSSGHSGRVWANHLGGIRLLYADMESGVQALRDMDDVRNNVTAGLGTDAVYRAARGVRSAAVADAVEGALVGLVVGTKQALKRYVTI